jgi:hypothetical protein
VSGNRRFPIPESRRVETLRVLGWGGQTPWEVSAAWINAVPLGPDLAAPAIPDVGSQSQLDGLRVGELVTGVNSEVNVVLPDGIATLTAMQARLMQTVAGVSAPRTVDNFLSLPDSKTHLSDASNPDGLPTTIPALADTTPGRVCITLPVDDKAGDGIRLDPSIPAVVPVEATKAEAAAAPGGILADFVVIARGKGVIASAAASPTAPENSGTVSIVTDTGRSFPLASRDLLTKLGYAKAKPRQIPSQLLGLLPQGPSLDPAVARRSGVQD